MGISLIDSIILLTINNLIKALLPMRNILHYFANLLPHEIWSHFKSPYRKRIAQFNLLLGN